ncbi:polysaccharide biosynthesis protein [Geoglobus acetivorans]|uniref:Polysaccharide biosynthesis protein n=2 Tax=Geoglobus acetivorans TaxID=565033 RepID=A0A0A7GF05_GEOAI|nr:polysaccharide biosynthesis protein [Geoglobus acetivorans]
MGILLPKQEFGVLGVALAILYITSVLTQNTFSWSGTRRIASSPHEASMVLRTVTAGNLALAVTASLAVLYYSYRSETYLIPNLMVLGVLLLSALTNSYAALLRAVKRFGQIAVANIMMSFLKLLTAVILVVLGMGAVGALGGLLISSVAVFIYLTCHATRLELPQSRGFSGNMIRETFFVSIIFLGINFIINSSIIFMRWFSGSDALAGDYNAALTIARGPFFITSALITVLFPYISSHSNTEREEYAFQSIKYVALFVFPVCISMTADPGTWLNIFFGRKYMGGEDILRMLSAGIGFLSLTFLVSSNLVAFERPEIPALCLVTATVVQVAMIHLMDSNPVTSSTISVVAASITSAVLLLTYYAGKFYFKWSPKYLLKIAVSYSILSAVFLSIHLNGRLLSLAEIAIAFTVYFIALSILKLFDEEDVDILLSPLPPEPVRIVRRLVSRLNSII